MSNLQFMLCQMIPSLCHLDMIIIHFFLPFDKQGIKGMFDLFFLYSFIKQYISSIY